MLKLLLLPILSVAFFSATNGDVVAAPSFAFEKIADIANPRGLFVDESGDVLVLSNGRVIALTEAENGQITQNTLLTASGIGLNHAVTHHKNYLYASSATTVYRWSYIAGSRESISSPPTVVINGIPNGGHTSRTLIFDENDQLYVSVGSNANVDSNSDRARIRRFDVSNESAFPISFNSGEIFADGLRNEVGLSFAKDGVLFGVENGADQLNRPDIGGDIHNGNPAEEMNRFDGSVGTHYGYPYCFSTYNLDGYEAGTQFAWPSFMNDGVHNDNWCRTETNNRPPALAMPAHSAPLGVDFYRGQNCGSAPGAFPCSLEGDAFVAFHGSWNSDLKVGYRVVHIPFTKSAPFTPVGSINNVLFENNLASCGNSCFRPVNAVFNQNGHLIISADSNNAIFRVTYVG